MIKSLFSILIVISLSNLYAENYFVDNLAPSGGNGSQNQPYNSIQAGIDILSPGDTLFIRGDESGTGQVYNEKPAIYFSGTETGPIVISNYAAEKVIVSFTSKLSIGENYWVFTGLIFDHLNDASDIIRLTGSNNVFRNCELRNGQRDGIDMSNGDNNIIELCTIHNLTNGSDIDAHGIIIENGNNNIFRHNKIFDCQGDCIQIYHGTASGTLIEFNDLYTTLGSGSENAVDFKTTASCTVRYNKMHGFRRSAGSDGVALKVVHAADNLVIEDNDIYDSNGGFRIGTGSSGTPDNIVFRRNLIHDLNDGGQYSYDGYGVQFDGVTNVKFQNNTLANIPGPLSGLRPRE